MAPSRKRRAIRLAGSIGALVILAGCNLAPDSLPPQMDIPERWAAETAEIASAWPSTGWWRWFDAPTLATLIAEAQANNTDIAAAAARVRQADAQIRIAGAQLLPALSGTAGSGRRWDGSSSGTELSNSFNAGLAASYELDLFGANRNDVTSAEASAISSRFDREAVGLTVTASVATTYFQILHFRDRLDVARRNLGLAERILEIVDSRVRNGAASPLDLAQQRTAVANQRAVLPGLESQLRQAENALAILMGKPPARLALIDGSILDVTVPPVEAGLPSTLLTRRPDIQSAEMRLIGANARIGAARAAFFPNMSLTANYGFASATLSTLLNPASLGASVAASVMQTIFSGGAREGQVDLAKGQYEELVQTYRKTVLDALGDVENALVAARRVDEQAAAQRIAAEQAEESFRLAEIRYREGEVDLLTVLDAQRSLYQAQDQLVQTRLARLQAAVSLFRALGGGWERPPVSIARR